MGTARSAMVASFAMLVSRLLLPLSLLFGTVTSAAADIQIVETTEVDSYYDGGVPHAAEKTTAELWVGRQRIARIADNLSVIVDFEKKTVTVVLPSSKSYVESTLPLDWAALASPEVAKLVAGYAVAGTVEGKRARQKVDGRKCSSYRLTSWIAIEGVRYDEVEAEVWATRDLPLTRKDLARLNQLLGFLRNYGPDLTAATAKIEGFPVKVEITHFEHGYTRGERRTVTAIAKKKPPPEVYGVPEGFEKKAALTIQDLRSL